jgi:hypothetical protein
MGASQGSNFKSPFLDGQPNVAVGGYPARISASSSLLAATMNQKSSLREVSQLVSWVLTGNKSDLFSVSEQCYTNSIDILAACDL